MMLPIVIASIGIIAVIGFHSLRRLVFRQAEKALLTTKPNGKEVQTDVGLNYEPLAIASGERRLQGWLVGPTPAKDAQKAILIFHGRYECISEWIPVQHFLWEHGIASMVFDYSGFGDSTGSASVANLRQFDGVILIAAYTSARDAAVQTGTLPRWLTFIVPDMYNNVRMIQRVHNPLLIIHSRDDQVFPVTMGEKIFAAANDPKYMAVLEGLKHNDILEGQAAAYLSPIPGFLGLTCEPSQET